MQNFFKCHVVEIWQKATENLLMRFVPGRVQMEPVSLEAAGISGATLKERTIFNERLLKAARIAIREWTVLVRTRTFCLSLGRNGEDLGVRSPRARCAAILYEIG
jgi:hypothetical protein